MRGGGVDVGYLPVVAGNTFVFLRWRFGNKLYTAASAAVYGRARTGLHSRRREGVGWGELGEKRIRIKKSCREHWFLNLSRSRSKRGAEKWGDKWNF